MSTLNCTVVRGVTLSPDSQDRVKFSKDRAHLLGEPTVTVDVTGGIDTEDLADAAVEAAKLGTDAVETAKIKDEAVTGAKLSASFQSYIAYLTIAAADSGSNAGTCTIQLKDGEGNDVSGYGLVRTWIADAAYSEPDPQTDYSVSTGEEMREIEADADYEVITDSSGAIVMDIAVAAPKTVHCMAVINGIIYTSSVAIT